MTMNGLYAIFVEWSLKLKSGHSALAMFCLLFKFVNCNPLYWLLFIPRKQMDTFCFLMYSLVASLSFVPLEINDGFVFIFCSQEGSEWHLSLLLVINNQCFSGRANISMGTKHPFFMLTALQLSLVMPEKIIDPQIITRPCGFQVI